MDYKKLGLKVGLEIHQQLDSGTKLFCRCPIMRSETLPIEIRRKLRAVPGEMGFVDEAALQEYLKNRVFVYRLNSESSCLVETDEDPPKEINAQAVRLAVQICKLLHCDIFEEWHVMRKTVVDGSAVSGFQRTVLVGAGGYVEGSFGKIGLQTISLEEDAGTPVAKSPGSVEYRIDRLGIPLIEIATSSDINSPQMAKDVAEHIGLLLRSVSVVRGIGSIRQDINVSIENGERIEIKGFQELDKIPNVVENEVNRQISLLSIKEELTKRGFRQAKEKPRDVTEMFRSTRSGFMRKVVDARGFVYALLLPKFAGLLKRQCGDRTFGKEMSAYAESYGLGIMHSDEDMNKYNLVAEFQKLKTEMKAGPEDMILITAGNDRQGIENALALVAARANHCMVGVPKETRTADGEGSKYARPLPGSGRLYPESDIPPVRMTKELLESAAPKTLVEKQEETVKTFVKEHGMKETLARALITHRTVDSKDVKAISELAKTYPKVDVNLIAKMVVEMPKEIKKRFNISAEISSDAQAAVLKMLNSGKIPADSIIFIFVDHLTGQPLDAAIAKYETLSGKELRSVIKKVVDENKGKKESVLMGLIMSKVRGRAEGERVSKILKEMI